MGSKRGRAILARVISRAADRKNQANDAAVEDAWSRVAEEASAGAASRAPGDASVALALAPKRPGQKLTAGGATPLRPPRF